MTKIESDLLTPCKAYPRVLSGFASDLGWPAGKHLDTFEFDGVEYKYVTNVLDNDQDILYFIYIDVATGTRRVEIWND